MAKMYPLSLLARRLRITTLILAAALVLAVLAGVFVPPGPHVSLEAGDLPRDWGVAVALVVVALVVLALFRLTLMLALVEAGERFSPGVTRHFRGFALLLLIAAGARIVLAPLVQLGLVLTSGARHFRLSLDDTDATMLLVSLVLFLVARLFDEAARIEEDNRAIV